ncbi:hypothetical protein OSB04_023643 [Centaurea solstitialis]|uniref:Uncharacterized protein n=1 Tax=Centaurea solstitialis TaxID=347529 RepID=A0AA38WD52_9ASTR|nr:hypothetical protein OSB04_023643 [Centaurea solstitialis]
MSRIERVKETPAYIESQEATGEIDLPLGFVKPSDYATGSTRAYTALIKQNNTLLYLVLGKSRFITDLAVSVASINKELAALRKIEAAPVNLERSIGDLSKRIDKIRITDSEPAKPTHGEEMNTRPPLEWVQGSYSKNFHPGSPSDIHKPLSMAGSWIPSKELPPLSKECIHDWHENILTSYVLCHFCGILTTEISRVHCARCKVTTCALCAQNYLKRPFKAKGTAKRPEQKVADEQQTETIKLLMEKEEELARRIEAAAKERQNFESEKQKFVTEGQSLIMQMAKKEEEMIKDLARKEEKIKRLKETLRHYKERWTVPPSCDKAAKGTEGSGEPSGSTYQVANKVKAILDTGATSCFISHKMVPDEALEPTFGSVRIHGLNSIQSSASKLREGDLVINGSRFPIPMVYVLDVSLNDNIQMLLGSLQGGVLIKGNEITLYRGDTDT